MGGVRLKRKEGGALEGNVCAGGGFSRYTVRALALGEFGLAQSQSRALKS